jgi:CHAT domain/SIR2-like domain
MANSVDVEIGLHQRDVGSWTVDLRFTAPDTDSEVRCVKDDISDLDESVLADADNDKYGQLLGDWLFGDEEVSDKFVEARTIAEDRDLPLRVRLFIGQSAPAMHRLHWETLRDHEGHPLALGDQIAFSRYLASSEWRRVRVRPMEEMRALVVVPDPSGSIRPPAERTLADIDAAAEISRVRDGLPKFEATELTGGGQASLKGIVEALRDGYDVLYLVCHGYLNKDDPQLLLESESGEAEWVRGIDLVQELRNLARLPRVAVIVSCQSSGTGEATSDNGALAALGPRLAQAGIPAVVAMQGNVTMESMSKFIPSFFAELNRHGELDRAMAAARNKISERDDWWMPVLYMRVLSGRAWYRPGFKSFELWPSLVSAIRDSQCTPVLGIGLTDSLIGSRQDIARLWAARHRFPLTQHESEDLPQVAQYVAVNQGGAFVRKALSDYVRSQLVSRYPKVLPQDLGQGDLDAMLKIAWKARMADEPDDAYTVLASLPFKMYVTTHPSTLLTTALREQGKEPVEQLCKWHDRPNAKWPESTNDPDEYYDPSEQEPLVLHLFGSLQYPESLVVSEDDYIDFVAATSADPTLIPACVRSAFSLNALLLLGFRLEDWDFRVLFRSVITREGRKRDDQFKNVAAQIDPESGQTVDPERARDYLGKYLQREVVDVFWGTVDDFARQLHSELSKDPH